MVVNNNANMYTSRAYTKIELKNKIMMFNAIILVAWLPPMMFNAIILAAWLPQPIPKKEIKIQTGSWWWTKLSSP